MTSGQISDGYWTSRRHGRPRAGVVSRRGFLRSGAALVGGLGGAALVGCGADEDGGTPPESTASPAGTSPASVTGASLDQWRTLGAEELRAIASNTWLEELPGQQEAMRNGPTRGGTIRINRGPPTSFDVLGAGATAMAVHPGTHNSLITFEWKGDFGPQNEIVPVPDLPESMEQADDLTLIFHLRDEPIYFHDIPPVSGRELTVEDIKYSIEQLKQAPFQGPTYRDVQSVETPDDKTVTLKFSQPAAYFMASSCIPVQWIIAREQLESPDGLATKPIGTGAFQFVEATRDVGIVYERNPRYFKVDPIYGTGERLPFLDRIEGIFMPDLATYNSAWAAGQVEYGYGYGTRFDTMEFLSLRPDAVVAITTPPPSAQPLFAVNSSTPPFDDVRVRRALQLAIDPEGLLEGVAQGMASAGYGQDWNFYDRPEGATPWQVEELGPWYPYKPDEAKKLLQAAGFEQGLGRPIELGWGTSVEGGANATYEAMADFLRRLGIEINVAMAADGTAYVQKLYGAQYQDLHVAWPRPAWDLDQFTYEQLHSKSTANFYKVNDPTLDELCERQQVLLDLEERREVGRQIMERDLDQAYRIWGVNYYKVMMRDPGLFNMSDHYLAWMTPGWGELKMELAWKQAS